MVTANELRIGNWVLYSETNEYVQVMEVMQSGLTVKFEKETTWIEISDFEPIPLTEKILLDCGCKKRPEGFIGFKIFAGTYLEINIAKKRTIIFLEDGSKCIDLKHNGFLHEFQNTIYSLTKTELIIKLW